MTETQQLTEDKKTIQGQELCVGDTCKAEESSGIAVENNGSKEYEQGKILRDQEKLP